MPNNRNGDNDRSTQPTLLGMRLDTFAYTRAAMAVGTSLLLLFALSTRLVPEKVSLKAGEIAQRTIIAPRSVNYTDTVTTENRRQEARESVPDQYIVVSEAESLVRQTIEDVFDAAATVRAEHGISDTAEGGETPEAPPAQEPPPDTEAMINDLRGQLEVALKDETLKLLVTARDSALSRLRSDAVALANQQMQDTIHDNTSDLQDAREAVQQAARQLPLTEQYQQLVADIAAKSLRPNLRYDEQKTRTQRNAAAGAVEPVRRQIQAGDVVIAAGETVTQRHIDIAKALGLMAPSVDYTQALALLVLLATVVVTFGGYLARFAPEIYADHRQMLLICAGLVLAAAGFRMALQWSVYAAIALGISTALAMIIAMLLNTRVAIVFSMVVGLLAGLVATGSDARLVIATILCSSIAAQSIASTGGKGVTVARAAGAVGVSNALILVVTSRVFGFSLAVNQIIAAVLGGLIAASVAVVAVMALERVVDVVTDLRLLELANPNEPTLHRLLTEAPGSYQSSVMVANIAEPAAEEIGARSLLVRVAALYHDIGKLKRPYFFIENQFGEENPHEKLKPRLSALTLIAHAKDGYDLAQEVGLPQQVSDVIRQHHGTSLATYPYHLAVEQAGEENVSEADFRYPGPKPQTREAALVMLADSVEAAARTLINPTREQIEELVDRIISSKVDDGQLDESPLTFDNLHTIRDSFVSTLHGMFHQRLKYPDQEEAEEEQEDAEASVEIPENRAPAH